MLENNSDKIPLNFVLLFLVCSTEKSKNSLEVIQNDMSQSMHSVLEM